MSDAEVQYRILSVIGEGGFGRVYHARMETPEGFHKDVAIKVLAGDDAPRELLQRFRDEARILGLIRDRAIVGVAPPVRLGDRWAVVMEFVDGVSCGTLVQKQPIPPGVAIEIVGEVARALHHAFHMMGPEGEPLQLLHRDIKPDNIQVTPAGEVRLLDFGIARANFAAREYKTRRSFGGTPGYIAPERLQGQELPVGDVFSLGVVLHELVTGVRPKFSTTVEFDPEGVIIAGELELPPEIAQDSAKLEVLKLAAWMRTDDETERPSARQVEEACRRVRGSTPPPFLREWAEEHVPHRQQIDDDDQVGLVLVPGAPTRPPSLVPPPRESPPPAPPQVATGTSRTAIMLLGGGAAFLLVLLVGVGVGALALGAWWLSPQPTLADAAPAPAPAAAPAPAPVPAAVVPAPVPVPSPPASPTEKKPPPEIVVGRSPRVAPVTVVPDAPQPAPPSQGEAPVPLRTPPTGLVVVKTVPSGATVRERGVALTPGPHGYQLPVGNHMLEISSPDGEKTRIPVVVQSADPVEICYSFDTNSACGAAP